MNEEKYQGLNLPQLLQLMHDIVPPEPLSWLPQTRGWWVLLFWLVAVVILGSVKWVQKRRRNRYRREALGLIEQVDPNAEGAATAIAGIVKRTALAVFPRKDVASLYGDEWARFLVKSCNGDKKVADSAELIAQAAYRSGIDASQIVSPAKRWIRVHRA